MFSRSFQSWSALGLLLLLFLFPLSAQAFEVDFSFEGGLRFNYAKNDFDYATTPPTLGIDNVGGSLLLNTDLTITFNDYVEFEFSFDIGEFSISNETDSTGSLLYILLGSGQLNQSADDIANTEVSVETCKTQARSQGLDESICNNPHWLLVESLFLRALNFTFYFQKEQWMSAQVGIISHNIGHGLIYDNFAIGVLYTADLSERKAAIPLKFEAGVFLPDSSFTSMGKQSPMVHLQFSYVPNDDTELSLFFVYLRDGNNLAGELLLPLWQEFYEDAYNKEVSRLSKSNSSPGLSCFQEKDVDAIKATMPPKVLQQQELCERRNSTLPEDSQQECPADKLYDNFYNQTCTLIPESAGNHFWVGIQGETKLGRVKLSGAAVLYVSSMIISTPKVTRPTGPNRRLPPRQQRRPPPKGGPGRRPPQPLTVRQTDVNDITPTNIAPKALSGLGFSMELVASYIIIPEQLEAKAFFLFATGDTIDNNTQTINAFSGISPRILHSNVFFSGGINAFSSQRNIAISGYNGKGYIVPGLSLEYEREKKAEATLTFAVAFAHEKRRLNSGKMSGRLYGYEFNASGGYFLLPWLKPVLEFDMFVPGNFMEPTTKVLFRLLVGVDFVF
jgi:hypothetical protein